MTKHFTLEEFTRSQKALELGINNMPSGDALRRLQWTAAGMERVRAVLEGKAININSAFRCDALNRAVGGAITSQHLKGEACDFTCPTFGTPRQIVDKLVGYVDILGIDQLIMEITWVHISFTVKPRGEVLYLKDGKVVRGLV